MSNWLEEVELEKIEWQRLIDKTIESLRLLLLFLIDCLREPTVWCNG